ncbi:L-aspartate oxidase [Bacillus sp. V3-13]|uniref:L-aspartate oxidase n=1 Tax=Bacillus sp. V3-13 TaxID=2053728 RepID=UPI000C76D190|nr:L-aspartate oxidase [Bacillus sp. V3-13]PLR75335.1 L-aspartate oxidase [Bacillus sp. V3-13]
MNHADVIIIGSGVAALHLAKKIRSDINVIILTKSYLINSNSYLAQGGVAAALGKADDPAKHYADTLEAGRHHNDEEAVDRLTKEGPGLIRELALAGCSFDRDEVGKLLLGMEGAHSEKRIVHGGGDATGKIIVDFLHRQLSPNVSVYEFVLAFELIVDQETNQCIGVKGKYADGETGHFFAGHVVVATGGCGQIYGFTSNAETVTGDGIALAYLAGAELADMEFVQFHPTLLISEGKAVGLISEAVRGEGAKLLTGDGQPIMENIHPLKDLAPRHIVSQTIYDYLKQGHQVYLDISNINNFSARFPNITALCEQNNIEIQTGLIPVVPGCHFLMGGIKTDLYGRTNIQGLYAIGEAACTGIHGANRLASNSLLEGLAYGKRLAQLINKQPIVSLCSSLPDRKSNSSETLPLPEVPDLKKAMMDYAGIVRTGKGLRHLQEWLATFHIEKWVKADLDTLSPPEIKKAFMLITAWLVTESALQRTESRGGHFRLDFPFEDDLNWRKKQIIHKRNTEKGERHEQIETAFAT